jgi:predicted nucleic acid-binding protein
VRLVVDTSILIAGLLKPSKVQRILLDPILELYLPEHALAEVLRHAPMMRQRAKLSSEAFDLLMALLTSQLEIVPEAKLRPWLSRAQDAIGHRDPGDVPFVAAAYAIPCDGIWSDDADFQEVHDIPVWTTIRLLKHLGL